MCECFTKRKAKAIAAFSLASLLALWLAPQRLCAQQPSQDAQPQESGQTLETLGSQMHLSLVNLRNLSMSLTEDLEKQQKRAETLQAQLTELTISSNNTNKRLFDSETKSMLLERDCKRKNKIIIAETAVIVLHVLGIIAALVLRAKGIKLPEIVNILW